MEIGKEIRRIRASRKWSQAKLAGAAGMGVSGISQIETGARNPSAVTLSKIAEALGVEVADLFPKEQPPLPLGLEQRRENARRLMDAGVSEATARGVSGVDHRSEDYWRKLGKSNVLENITDDGAAEKLLRFGQRMVAQWETELPERLEAEDQEWLRHTWTLYHEYIDILNSVKPSESSNKQELLGSLMDINEAAHRIQATVLQHNERSREAGRKELILQEMT
jgi:transcriptional regulator with XRE-family HTH domain